MSRNRVEKAKTTGRERNVILILVVVAAVVCQRVDGRLFSLAHDPVALFKQNWVFIPVGFCGAILGNISAVAAA